MSDDASSPRPPHQRPCPVLVTPVNGRPGDQLYKYDDVYISSMQASTQTEKWDERNVVQQHSSHEKPESRKLGENEIVCFGMLCDIRCQFITVRGSQVANILRAIQEQPNALHLSSISDTLAIYTSDNVMVGVVNHKTASNLASLPSGDQITYELFMETSKLGETISSYLGGSKKVQFDVVANVMGPDYLCKAVGQEMSERRLFLQRPYQLPEGVAYINPHYLAIDGQYEDEAPSCSFEEERCITDIPNEDQISAYDDPVSSIMDSSPLQEGLPRIEIDESIQTTLMEHQRDVVDFIIARERGITNMRTLWREDYKDEDITVFRHKITGVPSQAPMDVPSGILADDMGLGKTLSMIATIVSTLASAKSHMDPSGAMRTSRMKPTPATLVIVPSALLLDSWLEEIAKHVTPGRVRWHKYHGITRQLDLDSIRSFDIVLSTYGTVAADMTRNRGLLDKIYWYRIVLDEAHTIRNWSTKQFHALHQLSASSRWCMTGTPIQNSLEDLGALVRFIRLPSLEEPQKFRRYIVGGIKVAGKLISSNFDNLRALLSVVCIRRPNSLLALPGIEFIECRPALSHAERLQYNSLIQELQHAVEKILYRGIGYHDRYGVLESLLRLRLFCNGGLNALQTEGCLLSANEKVLGLLQQNEDASCSYCGCDILSMDAEASNLAPIAIHCRKLVCSDCVPSFSDDTSKVPRCPLCDGAEVDQSPQMLLANGPLPPDTVEPHSKIAALLENVRNEPTNEKCLIFSFWKKTLDLVSAFFEKENIQFARIDGSLSPSLRRKALQTFRNDADTKVLLVTFGTGSTGLNNLSIATRIHIFEPQWNPTVESQAIGRLFRHGQANKVHVMRYVCQNTIEEAVERRQLRKVELAHRGGLDGSRNDRSPDKTRFMALRDYIENYMISDDFKRTGQ